MTKALTITTAKGSEIRISMCEMGSVSATIGHRNFSFVKLDRNATLGEFLDLGAAKAPLKGEDKAVVRQFFAEAAACAKAYWAAYNASAEGKAERFHEDMRTRMYGRNSDH